MITAEQIVNANKNIQSTDIKGKSYAEVSERIKAFRQICPNGSIQTEILSLENGVVTMKTTVSDEEGKILATGMAQEKENSSFINKTSFIENCVPLDTEILTKNGWKYYYQVKEGDEVLSLNLGTQKVEFCKILKVNRYADKPILELKTSRFEARCTPQHKWIIRSQYKGIEKIETSELTNTHKIVQNVHQQYEKSLLGQKLGWLMCDCEIAYTKNGMPSSAYISQSKHVDELKQVWGEPSSKTKKFNEEWIDNYEWRIPSDTVREVLGAFGIASYKDLSKAMLEADINDVAGCFDSMMLADGESRGFSSTYIELIEAVQIMCARLGIATGKIKSRWCKQSTKPIYTLSIKRTDGAWFSEIEVTPLPPTDVWCPTTENGTWFMRQNNFVTLTSNCETSSVGRALGMCGLGVDMSIASALEVTNAINNQNEKPKKSEKKQDKAALTEEELNKQMADSVDKRLLPSGEIITQEQLELLFKEMKRTGINQKTILSFAKVDSFEKIPQATFIGIMSKMEKTPDAQ